MNLLFTGRGTSGSWKIRGEQLAAAMGQVAWPMAHRVAGHDAVIGVKRLPDELIAQCRAKGVRLIWDPVDAWPQPAGNLWTRDQALTWLRGELDRIRPYAVIAATDSMRMDILTIAPDLPVRWLPHHHRPGIAVNPIRQRIERVGYEGAVSYIAPLRAEINAACRGVGAEFVVNPRELADVDVVIALRAADGYPVRQWKSGVKLANAHASGTPFVGQREYGYLETCVESERWVDGVDGLPFALRLLADQPHRQRVAIRFRANAYPVEKAAQDLRAWLARIL